MICDATRLLGGKHFQIVGIIPPGQDPHIYTPRPQDGIFFRRAALILVNGLQLEGKMLDMIEGVGKKSLKLAEDPAISPRKTQGSADPHVWWSALYFARYAEKIRDALSSLLPNKQPEIHARAARYTEELRKLHAWAKASLAQIPREKRLMITSHDAFYYFGQAYDIEVDAVLGISTEAQARAIEPLRLASLAVKRGIRAIFHENSVSQAQNDLVDSIQRLAKQKYKHEIKIAGPLYSDSLADPSKPTGSYIGAFRANVEMIAQALGTKPLPWPLAL
jgi:manganese/zinc/iron transport system substrate-binding protein